MDTLKVLLSYLHGIYLAMSGSLLKLPSKLEL